MTSWFPPVSTYRLQLQPGFTFAEARDAVDYLADLGVSHLYLSPILEAVPGSTHGYDVVDHSQISQALGGRPGLIGLAEAAHARDVGLIVDVVPNHMAVPTPLWHNRVMWSILRDGPGSPFAPWLDVDWSAPDRAVLMPVLGSRIGQVIDAGELTLDTAEFPTGDNGVPNAERVLRYFDHVLPVRAGTEDLPLPELVDRQWYRLAHWRVADEELNYRRFFDIDTLAAVRVELPDVFHATHAALIDTFADGTVDGFRIDHPDGLADPRGYLDRLGDAAAATGRTTRPWVVVEKIMEGDERLPDDWRCDGTTGYDALRHVSGLFTNPFSVGDLQALYTELAGDDAAPFEQIADAAKREVVAAGQYTEVHRLVDVLVEICHDDVALRDHTRRGLDDCTVELLVAMDRYRAYVVPGEKATDEAERVIAAAAARARDRLPDERHDTLDVVVDLVLGRGLAATAPGAVRAATDESRRREVVVRFQQTCGPVMAKGVEDTAFYRWHRLVALNEVGGDPTRVGVSAAEFHAFAADTVLTRPTTMTTLTTHDTKRSEDARARLLAAVEDPRAWVEAVRGWHEGAARFGTRDGWPDGGTEYLLWQTLVATWPISAERLVPYLTKAVREAKRFTSWVAPDEPYESAVTDFALAVLADDDLSASIAGFVADIGPSIRAVTLGQKLLQLVMPGVPDVYQGTECTAVTLVDPDNRGVVDFDALRQRLRRLDEGDPPTDLDDEKLVVTSRALRLRRAMPEVFVGGGCRYWPLATSSGNAVGVGRGAAEDPEPVAIALVTRHGADLLRLGGWGEHVAYLPTGRWHEELTGRTVAGGEVRLADVLATYPVALLRRAT